MTTLPHTASASNSTNSAKQLVITNNFVVREWRPYQKNTLVGFLSLELPSGLVLHGCTLHQKNGSRWIGMPAKSFEKDGATTWAPLVEFASKEARERFQTAALEALDGYLALDGVSKFDRKETKGDGPSPE
jgi:hypothetical protein